MKQMDPAAARQVWQRVSAQTTDPVLPEREALMQLHRQLKCDGAAFHQSTLRAAPAEQVLLRQLEQAYTQEAACIKGILTLTAGVTAKVPGTVTPTQGLRRCYHNALARLSFYSLRTADPLCAPVYRQLEQQTRQHCLTLLTLLGMEGK